MILKSDHRHFQKISGSRKFSTTILAFEIKVYLFIAMSDIENQILVGTFYSNFYSAFCVSRPAMAFG